MDSKQASKNSVHEMVPIGTSTEALIYAIAPKTEQLSADPDLVPVKFTVISSRKRTVLLATLAIAVVIAAIFVGIFLSQRIKNKDKEESQQDNVKSSLSVKLTSNLNDQTQQAASSSTYTENYMEIKPSVKMTSTLSSQTQLEAPTSILASSIETRTTTSACSTCNKLSLSREDIISSPASSASPLSSIMELVPNTDAKWSRWSPWSDCTKTCGNGIRFRTRTCVAQNQPPVSAHISCAGKPQQTSNCSQWKCPDCRKTCLKGTLNAACDACVCDDHVLTGRVETTNNAPIAGAKVALSETPYKALARTDEKGFFKALNVCADANQELLISIAGFVPMKTMATVSSSKTANVQVKLQESVPPIITVHPQSKIRFSGDAVTFCCDGEGNPSPEIEWFKDNNIIDKSIYAYDKHLNLSNVTGLMGKYRCRVVNDYGAEFSEVADLKVFSSRKKESCNPTPISKNATLPTGCVVNGTTSNIIDVGECQPTPCIRNDSVLSKRTCRDEKFCCSVEEVSDVTIRCGSSVTFAISKASRCGCQKCEEPKSKINGVLVGRKGQTEKPISYGEFAVKGSSYWTDDSGFFSFEVPAGTKRVSVVFRDTYDEEYADLTKVFHVEDEQTSFSKIILKPKPIPQSFNSSEPYKVQLGESQNDTGFAEIEIPGNSLLRVDGSVFSGQANLRMDVVDTRSLSDMVAAPADFTTLDEDGEEQMLVSYGMLSLDFEEDGGNKLSPFRPIKLYLDPEKLNISVDSDGNTTTKLWWLNSKTGRWIEASNMRVLKNPGRGKRSVRHFLLKTEIVADISRRGRLNIDWPTPDYAAVRVSAPRGSSIRLLCEEPPLGSKRYTGYFEETVSYSEIVCINLWVNRSCYIQGESDNSTFLEPSHVDNFPSSVSATIVENEILEKGNRKLKSFRFTVKASDDGPVFSWKNGFRGIERCRTEAGLKQFELNYPVPPSVSLLSVREKHLKSARNWYPVGDQNKRFTCFIKILTRGEGPLLLVTSYWPNETYTYGNSVETAEKLPGKNVFVACVEIRCPGKVYHPNSKKKTKDCAEWTYLHVTHLTGKCNLKNITNHLSNQDNLYNDNKYSCKKKGSCPHHSKSHSPGSAWLCVPLPPNGFRIHFVYTTNKDDVATGKNRCLAGDNSLTAAQSKQAEKSEKGPTVEFSCS